MASFAKIGLNSKVIEVLSVVNEVLHDSNGIEQEVNGIDFLTKLTGYPWILNEDTCLWNAPVSLPTGQLEQNQYYYWNESIINWEIKTK